MAWHLQVRSKPNLVEENPNSEITVSDEVSRQFYFEKFFNTLTISEKKKKKKNLKKSSVVPFWIQTKHLHLKFTNMSTVKFSRRLLCP